MVSAAEDEQGHRWEVSYSGGPYGGVASLELRDGVLSLRPISRPPRPGSIVPLPPGAPESERPLIHTGKTVDVFRARWLSQGSVHVHAEARTYVAITDWRPLEREIIPALHMAGFEVEVRMSRFGYGTKIAAARFFPGLLKAGRIRDASQQPR